MKLPERSLDINTLFNAKLVALLSEDDPILRPNVKTFRNKVEMVNSNSPYFHLFVRDLHESDRLLYMDDKLVVPFALKNAIVKNIHEDHPEQFGMTYVVKISGGLI